MIQRMQSILLVCIGVMLIVAPFIPNWKKEHGNQTIVQTGISIQWKKTEGGELKIVKSEPRYYILITCLLSAGMSFFSILSYKNRKLQMVIGALNSLVIVTTLGLMLYKVQAPQSWIMEGEPGRYQLGLFLPMIAIMMNIISNRLIRRDERLVRSMDRIR